MTRRRNAINSLCLPITTGTTIGINKWRPPGTLRGQGVVVGYFGKPYREPLVLALEACTVTVAKPLCRLRDAYPPHCGGSDTESKTGEAENGDKHCQ